MNTPQKYYHGHLPARFTIEDIYGDSVQVERLDAGKLFDGEVLLDGQPVRRIFIENDGTIVLMTPAPPLSGGGLAKFYFHGSQFWDMLHRNEHGSEEPIPEYAGALEAQLAYIRQISNSRDEAMPRSYPFGGNVIES